MGAMAAGTWNWNVTSGTWNQSASTNANWDAGSFPPSNTDGVIVNLTNGTELTPAETTLTVNWLAKSSGGVTIGANNTLSLQAVLQANGAGPTFENNGTVQATSIAGSIRFGANTATNNGVIQAIDTSLLTVWDTSNLTNNGTIQSKTGGTIRFWGNGGITGGMLKTESGGFLLNDASGNSNQTLTLTGVAVTNAGTFTNSQTTNGALVAGTITTNLASGTGFTNSAGALTEVKNAGDFITTGNTTRNSVFTVNTGATFNNEGTLLIQNDAARTGTTTSQSVTFTVASGATAFTNTGTIQVIANTTAVGATSTFTSAKSITNDGIVHIKGNAASQFATFSVTGAGNDYTQSAGSGRRTVLEQGGALTVADQVLINGGTFGGVGTVTGATTIGSGATLIAGDTYAGTLGAGVLAFNNTLNLGDNASVKFGLGANTAASGQIALVGTANVTVGTNVTLTLSDLTGGNWVSGTTYRIFDLDTGTIGSTSFVVNLIPSGWEAVLSSGAGGTDYLDVTLTAVTPVPEPSSSALLGAGIVMLWTMGRRRRV